jgi:ABC-type glutathione transport system ATPase component
MKKAIITISGVSGSGKDEVRKIIQKYITPSNKRINFADKLKQTASILLGVDVKKFEDQDFKNSYLMDWGMTVREFLQKLGTEAIRNG